MNLTLDDVLLLMDSSTRLAADGRYVEAVHVLNVILKSIPHGYSPPEHPGLFHYLEGQATLLEALSEGSA